MNKVVSILLLFFTTTQIVKAQDTHDFQLIIEDKVVVLGKCLTRDLNFNSMEFRTNFASPDNLEIIFDLIQRDEQLTVKIRDFNGPDLKFWLLENRAFQSGFTLSITMKSIRDNQTISVQKKFCLSAAEGEFAGSMPGNPNDARGRTRSNPYVMMSINFATDRNFDASKHVNEQFGSERSDLKYGVSKVSIPKTHEIGEIERPSLWRFEFSEDPKKHIVIHENKVLSKDAFFDQLKNKLGFSAKKSSFLFVHGYNVTFADAARRTAQMSYDLKFDGEPVFYSWPSKAEVAGYTMDEANIKWAQTNIKHFVIDYLDRSGAEEIFLIAHSMGNRGLTRAIIEALSERPELKSKIKEVILAAPDIDADVFKRDIAPKMAELIQKPITLYVSADDVALEASKKVHGYPRAGDAEYGLVLVDGVETIDATGIDTSFLSHSYFAETESIIQDMTDLIRSGQRAANRTRLKLMNLNNLNYWQVIKN